MAATYIVMHPANRIKQDAENRFVTDAQISAWNAKANSTHTHTIANVTNLQSTLDTKIGNAPTLVTNWNTGAVNPGYYYSAKSATGAPETTLGYYGSVVRSATTVLQTIYPEGASGDVLQYIRRGTRNASTGAVTWEANWLLFTLAQ